MKFLDWCIEEDFGKELNITLLKGNTYSFIQLSLDWNDYGEDPYPYIQISMGNRRLIDILFYFWRVGFYLAIFSHTWKKDTLKTGTEETTTTDL